MPSVFRKKRTMERSKYTCTNVNHCRKKVTTCITQLPRAIVLVLSIKYDARAAKIQLSVIVCYFFNEMLSQINKEKTRFKRKCVYCDVNCRL